jgi:hypothetical protein
MPARSPLAQQLRVFISSTFSDLQEYRQAAFDSLQALGVQGDNMVYWSADERSGAELSTDRVRESDLLVLLLAHRYGYIPAGSAFSVTELEYRAARDAGIPVLAFLLDETAPWPPDRIDYEHRDRLLAFRRRVETEVARLQFRSTDELARQVLQSVASFVDRRRDQLSALRRFSGPTLRVEAATSLLAHPDTVVQIGEAENGLPLLVAVRRTHDLQPHLDALAQAVSGEAPPPQALLLAFRQALESHARQGWARERMRQVEVPDGATRSMYVLPANLTRMFRSCFALLLNATRARDGGGDGKGAAPRPSARAAAAAPPRSDIRTVIQAHTTPGGVPPAQSLQSEGGANRFLAIDPATGASFSVGRSHRGRWVQWRPFRFESLSCALPRAMASIVGRHADPVPLVELPGLLMSCAADQPASTAARTRVAVRTVISVERQDLAAVIMQCARRLAAMHASGLVHGDLKPDNVLLGAEGPELIDEFALPVGAVSPGWTPGWSAPEQILGEAVVPATDLYPVGRMITDLLDGDLVGEVRKFKARLANRSVHEFDVFFNPNVHVAPGTAGLSPDALASWVGLARQCLRFDPAERPASAAHVADQVQALLAAHPLQGVVGVELPQQLHVAMFPDGRTAVAAVIGDVEALQAPVVAADAHSAVPCAAPVEGQIAGLPDPFAAGMSVAPELTRTWVAGPSTRSH